MELPFGGTFASDTFETGTARGGVGRHHDDHRLRRAALRRARTGRPRRLARQGGRPMRHRLRLPPDHRRRRRRLAQGDGRARRPRASRSFKLFMAYPGVFYSDDGQILRAMQTGRRQRRDHHDARRERHGDRRPGQAGARPRRDRADLPRADPAVADRGGGDPPGDHAGRSSPAPRSTSCTCPPGRPSTTSARPATRARTSSARPARSTCTCRSRSSSARRDFEGAKWVCSTPLRSRAEGPPGARPVARPAHQRPVGGQHRPLPVLLQGAEGAGPAATSRRSPTGSARSSTAWT